MVNETTIIIRNRNDKGKSIKDAVEVAEILKNRMYPRIGISNVSLGSRPYFNNRQRGNYRKDNRKKIDRISKIEITLQTKSMT